jgi:transposase InsO family protein
MHLEIVQAFVAAKCVDSTAGRRQGLVGQQPRRQLEQQVRCRAATFAEQLALGGYPRSETARRLGVSARTLRCWQAVMRRRDVPVSPLGRPLLGPRPEEQQAVIACLHDLGPGVGVPSLRARFTTLARTALKDLLQSYRRHWQAEHTLVRHILLWQQPGTVWATDFVHAPMAIDGRYPYLLAMRDLASGYQLLWLPVETESAAEVGAALTLLFTIHGAPLVLKMDNGAGFTAAETKQLLETWQVAPLYSPPRTPSYNGAIEAANGAMKKRTQQQTASSGRSSTWTSDDAEAAHREANATARPRRLHGRTPDQVWTGHNPPTHAERASFQATIAHYRDAARRQHGLPEGDLLHAPQTKISRLAIRRALVAHDLLQFRRRRIPAPIPRPKVTSKR